MITILRTFAKNAAPQIRFAFDFHVTRGACCLKKTVEQSYMRNAARTKKHEGQACGRAAERLIGGISRPILFSVARSRGAAS